MDKERLNKMLTVAERVAQDVENDAKNFDGKPFNGKTMAEYMGNHGAAIQALAKIIIELLKEKQNE